MSKPASQPGNIEDGEYDHIDPQTMQDLPAHGESKFGDSSGQLFSMYSKVAEDEDDNMVQSSQKNADGILIFTGLFSASLSSFITVSVQDLRQSSQDVSAYYLGKIYEVLADPNVTLSSIPSIAKPPPFTPKMSAIVVNSLFLLSFVLSLVSALFATLLQQWARLYIRVTQPVRCGPEKQARMRAYFSHGAEKLYARAVVQRLPLMLHLSLFIFLTGLSISLYYSFYVVFNSVTWSIAFKTALMAPPDGKPHPTFLARPKPTNAPGETDPPEDTNSAKFSRLTLSTFYRAITGHAFVGEYTQRFHAQHTPDQIACACGRLVQTIEHVLLECPLYAAARRKHLAANGRAPTLPQLFESRTRVLGTLRFLEETGACAKPRAVWDPE